MYSMFGGFEEKSDLMRDRREPEENYRRRLQHFFPEITPAIIVIDYGDEKNARVENSCVVCTGLNRWRKFICDPAKATAQLTPEVSSYDEAVGQCLVH